MTLSQHCEDDADEAAQRANDALDAQRMIATGEYHRGVDRLEQCPACGNPDNVRCCPMGRDVPSFSPDRGVIPVSFSSHGPLLMGGRRASETTTPEEEKAA